MALDVKHILAFNSLTTPPPETVDNPETIVSGLSMVSRGVGKKLNAKMCCTSRTMVFRSGASFLVLQQGGAHPW